MGKNNGETRRGVSTLSLLGIAFVVLKLTHVIDWSWWWVTLPFWGILAVILVAAMIAGIILLLDFLMRK